MTEDYKNFSKVADLAVERVRLKNVESHKFCETDIAKKMAHTPFKIWLCVKNSVQEKKMFNRRNNDGG